MARSSKHQSKALITGISGQDGAYLAKLLLEKGYRVIGCSRDAINNPFSKLRALAVFDRVELQTLNLLEFSEVSNFVHTVRPDEIYHLSGQSSVAQSFISPRETIISSSIPIINLLESVRTGTCRIKVFNCTSSECFGNTELIGATETTAFNPRSPYGVGKVMAHSSVELYRCTYGLYCCSGILFNHESALRPPLYVTQKIIQGAKRIAAGELTNLRLGNLDVTRDWGLASEYIEAMWLMLQQEIPNNYIIATGRPGSLREFLALAFENFGLNWQDHVVTDEALLRTHEIEVSVGNPSRIQAELGWQARSRLPDVVRAMVTGAG